jgi:hypothetical protein
MNPAEQEAARIKTPGKNNAPWTAGYGKVQEDSKER